MRFGHTIILCSLIFSLLCPRAWAYRHTPQFIVTRLLTMAHSSSLDEFQSHLSRRALCVWGTPLGMELFKEHLPRDPRQLTIELKQESAEHLSRARFVGYWSYYSETYALSLIDKRSGVLLAEGEIECHFGVSGTRRASDLHRPLDEYPQKNCKLALLESRSFSAPQPSSQCALFRQTLDD